MERPLIRDALRLARGYAALSTPDRKLCKLAFMALKKVAVTFVLVIVFFSACQHASETRPTDGEIQRLLPGVWRLDAGRSDDDFPPLIAFKDRNIYTLQTMSTQL